jgi:hypothetical protein
MLREEKMEEEERRPPRKRKRSMSPDSAEEDRTKTRMSSGPVHPNLYPGRTDLRPTEAEFKVEAEVDQGRLQDKMRGDSDMLGSFAMMLAAADGMTEGEELEEMEWRRETWLASEAGGM